MIKLSGNEWEGEAGWGAGSLSGAAGVIVSEVVTIVSKGWDEGEGRYLEGHVCLRT